MAKNIFLDDERQPVHPRRWRVCRSYDEAVIEMLTHGCPSMITFDHDLGLNSKTGYDLAKWMVDMDLTWEGKFIPADFTFEVHSQNPVGKANIEALLNNYLRQR